MTACAICATTGHLILTRQGLRCGACLRGEAEEARTWMEAYKAIVVDLAACNPWNPLSRAWQCRFCLAEGKTPEVIRHFDGCLQRRAVEATKP